MLNMSGAKVPDSAICTNLLYKKIYSSFTGFSILTLSIAFCTTGRSLSLPMTIPIFFIKPPKNSYGQPPKMRTAQTVDIS